jgi:hypothetical protein
MGNILNSYRFGEGVYEGYKYWRFRPCTVDGTPYAQAYFAIYELNLYENYDQIGSSHPTTLLTGDSSNPNFLVTSSSVRDTGYTWEAFNGITGAGWQPDNSTASWLVVELNRNRLFKSLTIKTYNNDFVSTHIKVEASHTGAWAGEEVLIGITDNFQTTISTQSYNLYGEEYPTKCGLITKTGSSLSSISMSVVASTPPSGETIVAYHWYLDGVFKSESSGNTHTITGLPDGTNYLVTVKAEASGGNIGNSSSLTIGTDSLGINYVKDNGSGSYLHYRFQAYHADSPTILVTFISQINSYDGVDLGGTRYPTAAVTSPTSDANFTITHGYEFNSTTYADWKAFNLATHSGWWTLANNTAANAWVQIEFGTAKILESVYVSLVGTYTKADQLRVYGSATGAFTGEEVIIGTVSSIVSTSNPVANYQFNLDTDTYGANVITNYDFSSGLTDWTTVTGTPSVVGGKLILEANEAIKQLHTMSGSHLFKITISNMTSGELSFDLDGTTVKTLVENGTHQFVHTPTGQGIELTANASFDGEIDSVEIMKIN